MTLVCRIESRFPVAVVGLHGTLDYSAAIETAVTLQGCLAEQPVLLVLDAAHLEIANAPAVRPLTSLVRDARRWPGTQVAVSAASPAVRELFTGQAGEGAVDFYPSAGEAVAAGHRIPVSPWETVELPPTRDAPAASREVVARACQRWRLGRWSRLTQLLASELVTNAVVHARTQIWFTLRHVNGALQVVVRDGDPRLVEQPPVGPHRLPAGEPGRGLLLLSTLADDWGCAPTSDGKVTWANIALTGHPAAPGEQPRPPQAMPAPPEQAAGPGPSGAAAAVDPVADPAVDPAAE
jgi:anti-sigma regulatory factor (Ser/Thr protein kinase)